MYALLSLPYVYSYGYIVALMMILALSISVELYVAFPRARKYVPPVVAIIGFVNIQAFPRFADGIGLGFLTLTCAGMMATVYFKKVFIFEIVTALAFVAFGGFLISKL